MVKWIQSVTWLLTGDSAGTNTSTDCISFIQIALMRSPDPIQKSKRRYCVKYIERLTHIWHCFSEDSRIVIISCPTSKSFWRMNGEASPPRESGYTVQHNIAIFEEFLVFSRCVPPLRKDRNPRMWRVSEKSRRICQRDIFSKPAHDGRCLIIENSNTDLRGTPDSEPASLIPCIAASRQQVLRLY